MKNFKKYEIKETKKVKGGTFGGKIRRVRIRPTSSHSSY